jgi:hypothetical protein
MGSMMQQLHYEVFRQDAQRRGDDDEAAYKLLPVARAGLEGPLHRAVEWLGRQLAAWQELQDELNCPTQSQHSIPPGTPIGEVL